MNSILSKYKPRTYKHINFPPLTDAQIKRLEALDKISDSDIDLSDAPELDTPFMPYYS